jgi:hypothetical protein
VSTAIHESAHLVLMLAFGFRVQSASVVPDADSFGRVVPGELGTAYVSGPPLTDVQLALIHAAAVVVCAAGGAAQRLAGCTPAGCDDDEADGYSIAHKVWELIDVPPFRWQHLAPAEAERYLLAHWATVEHLAVELIAAKTLTGVRAAELAGRLPVPELRSITGAFHYWSERAARDRARVAV